MRVGWVLMPVGTHFMLQGEMWGRAGGGGGEWPGTGGSKAGLLQPAQLAYPAGQKNSV